LVALNRLIWKNDRATKKGRLAKSLKTEAMCFLGKRAELKEGRKDGRACGMNILSGVKKREF